MDSETTISQGIRQTDANAAYDAACKRLLSEKIILAWIMKQCLDEYHDCDVNDIAEKYIEGQPQVSEVPVMPDENGTVIHGLDTEDKSLTEGTVTYDIRFHAVTPDSGEQIRLIVNLEAQNDYYPGYPLIKRGIYYCSRMISSQYGREFTNSHYENVRKVYSIWICTNPPKNRRNTISRYRMYEENIVGEAHEKTQNYDLLSVILLCLGGPDDENYDGVLKLLDVLISSDREAAEKRQVLQDDFDIKMTQKLESEVSVMCNLSKGVEEKAMAKGLEKGLAEGVAKGLAEGVAKGKFEEKLNSIRTLMETLGLTVEQAMAALKVPDIDRPEYIRLLDKE